MWVYTKDESETLLKALETKRKEEVTKNLRELEFKQTEEVDQKLKDLEAKRQEEVSKQIRESENKLTDETAEKLKMLEDRRKEEVYQQLKDLENQRRDEVSKQLKDQKTRQTDEINDKLEELENKRKKEVFEQLNELENKRKEEVTKSLKELDTRHTDAKKDIENKLTRERWIIGEYKWMSIGSKMPDGWIKIDLLDGYTLVQGKKVGETTGSVKKHNHLFGKNDFAWSIRRGLDGKAKVAFTPNNVGGESREDQLIPFIKTWNDSLFIDSTSFEGDGLEPEQKGNLAAGLFAELWQYKGI
ncbi:MAG: hypothetical protein ACRC8P_01710 [Spiroplasma sp.]